MRTKIELENLIDNYATAYYNGEEIVSDKEYDALIEELRAVDPENKRIPGMAGEEKNPAGYVKVPHILTTGTLEKAMTTSSFEDWFNKKSKVGVKKYHISTKMDGIGCELQYENGELAHFVSRGDGYTGFDKMALAEYVNLPRKTGEGNFSVRGELEVKNNLFKDPYFNGKKNPRNAVAGLFNRKASELNDEDKRILSNVYFVAYDYKGSDMPKTKSEVFNKLVSLTFKVPANKTVSTLDEVYEFRNFYAEERMKEEYFALDGIVIFDDKIDTTDQLEKVQKSAIALKFDLTIAITKIVGVDWSYKGRYFNPIAVLEPVELEGTTVTHANLCNLNLINKLGIKIGDKVAIAKKGEIIPQVQYKVNG
ncbi:MAG: hypothetical protein HUJ68_10540 [Clostridia bacterium]|nr:hypothetical protein [Clostridia bacterium]